MNFTIISYRELVHSVYKQSQIRLGSDVQTKRLLLGLDPGSRHMGITVYYGNTLFVNQIDLIPEKDSVKKMLHVCTAVRECVLSSNIVFDTDKAFAAVEGSSYGERFGQTELAEARAASILTLCQLGFIVKKIPPTQIRKLALGDGKNKGECFGFLPDAGASFLACLVAIQY